MIESLAYSITDWINNDFELPDGSRGSSFLSNPEQFFTNLADRTAGEFIGSFDIAGINLCSPFSLNIRLDLLKQYRRDYRQRATCTLSQVVQNMDGFVNQGDFRQGGWAGWMSLTQSPSNNYYGSYILASDELGARIVSARNRVTLDLSNGKGFLSFRKCAEWQTTDVAAKEGNNIVARPTKKTCAKWGPTRTPGSLIEEQANRSLGNTENRLVFANSFDQVVTALVNTLMKKVLQGFSNN
jgi:hypothetical protein